MLKSILLVFLASILFFSCGGGSDNDKSTNDVIDSGSGGSQDDSSTDDAGYSPVNYSVDWESEFTYPEQDDDGWSVLTPSSDSLLIYVSSDSGNDGSAETYTLSDSEIGDDPYNPEGTINAFATIGEAVDQLRDGYPDYILLKRGETWEPDATIFLTKGRSLDERVVLTTYGSSSERPTIKNCGVNFDDADFSAVIGIHFVASKRNPSSADFAGFDDVPAISGFNALGGYGNSITQGILIEDCHFDWFKGNVIQSSLDNGGEVLTEIIVRRNIITNNYSTDSHSQGLYTSHVSMLLEENIFDHNGWYKQGSNNAQEEGMATMFNHDTYFTDTRNTIFRRNLFLRASSIGTKFTANSSGTTDEVNAWNILLDNNLYIEGEIAISMGGNTDLDDGPRWENIYIVNNVIMHVGRTQPTNRTLGWGIGVDDWDTGLVQDNIITSWGDADTLTNNWAILSQGHTSDVQYTGNIINDVYSGQSLVQFQDGSIQEGITFNDNVINTNDEAPLLYYSPLSTSNFYDNYFYSKNADDKWFYYSEDGYISFEEYKTHSGDTSSVCEQITYANSDCTIETYLDSIGLDTDMDAFVEALVLQSKYNWESDLLAETINDYVRDCFIEE
jgi:hypothetical protein